MSILMGPYEKESRQDMKQEEDIKDLMMFGYQCKLYRDDVKSELENSGSLLIPWMNDSSLMIDRYDIRNHFDDKTQFGLKPNLPYHMTSDEQQLELLIDNERYQSLDNDITLEELNNTNIVQSYSAIGFNYDVKREEQEEQGPELLEHPPSNTADVVQDETDMYTDPPTLNTIPFYIERPYSKKFQSIIEKTALFVSQQGQQMEIIIKTKQKYNPQFSFLHHEDRLFPYYKQLLHAITSGSYTVTVTETVTDDTVTNVTVTDTKEKEEYNSREEKEEQSDSINNTSMESDDETELHPLLRTTIKTKPHPPSNNPVTMATINSAPNAVTMATINSTPAVTINSAPSVTHNEHENNTSLIQQQGHYDVMSAYYHASSLYTAKSLLHQPPPPPPDIQPIVDRTADYVAKNGLEFERTVIHKHIDDRRFDFLHPWNEFNDYYKMRVDRKKEEILNCQPLNTQRLTSQGNVSFKLTNKMNLPVGGTVDELHYEQEQQERKRTSNEQTTDFTKRQKLSSGQIDGEFKKFLNTVKEMLK